MTKVKGHRERQAEATRRVVASAARKLFAARGYAATSIDAISQEAEVPAQTIYSAFGSKPAILEEVRRSWIAESMVADLHAQALGDPDPAGRLRRAAHWTRRQFELGADVVLVHQEAARADARVAVSWRAALEGREAAIRALLKSIAADLAMPVGEAVDLYVALTVAEVYRTLVLERGWDPDRYEAWLGELLCGNLLQAGGRRGDSKPRPSAPSETGPIPLPPQIGDPARAAADEVSRLREQETP